MSGSGVYRLRQARKSHDTMKWDVPADTVSEHAGPGTNESDVNVGSGLAPKKARKYVFNAGDTDIPTGTPPSNEHPSRGEHGRNTSNTTRKNSDKA